MVGAPARFGGVDARARARPRIWRVSSQRSSAAKILDLPARNFHISAWSLEQFERSGCAASELFSGGLIARAGVSSARGMAVARLRACGVGARHRGVEYQGPVRGHGDGRPRQVRRRRGGAAVGDRRAPAASRSPIWSSCSPSCAAPDWSRASAAAPAATGWPAGVERHRRRDHASRRGRHPHDALRRRGLRAVHGGQALPDARTVGRAGRPDRGRSWPA